MKKILFILIIFLSGICVVSAKETALTCVYSNETLQVGIRCVIYNNYSHQCYLERNSDDANEDSNKESILNWTEARKVPWTARQVVQQNKRCVSNLVFSLDTYTGYHFYAAKDDAMATEYVNILGSKFYIAPLTKEYRGVLFNDEKEDEGASDDPSSSITDPDYKITDTDIQTVCSSPSYRKPAKFVGTIVNFLRIIIPIVIIVLGVADLFKGVTASKDDVLKKSVKSLGLRALAGVAIFLLPGLVLLVLSMVNEWSGYKNTWCCCAECILNSDCDTSTCNSDTCRIEGTD